MRSRPIYDVVALLARCGVGMVFIAHGWQKIQVGVTLTGRNLDAIGTPLPTAAAVYSTFVELLGGAALILGVALPAAGALLFIDMAGALIFVHGKHGIFLVDGGRVRNGFELVLVLGLAALVFAVGGGGRLTLDHWLFGRRDTSDEDDEPTMNWARPVTEPRDHGIAAGEFPAKPDEDAARSRRAAETVTDTSRDVIVAGPKKKSSGEPATTKPSSDGTAPVRTRKKPPKSGS